VWDRDLYDFVLRSVPEDVPSVNVILTTTNHPPYDLPAAMRPRLSPAARALASDAQTLAIFEHEAYADRELGRFVEIAGRKLRQSFFAVTGDHAAHAARLRHGSDASAEAEIVPMVFTGEALPAHLGGVVRRAGSHLDIAPTLYELCAPAGFVYRSFGENLFAQQPERAMRDLSANEGQAARTLSRAALQFRH
jgi:phosphoglycerol transferase MdoB-like AlkP superfamily enzyme